MNTGGEASLKERVRRWKYRHREKLRIKTWVLLILVAGLGFVDATLLRLDHIRMTELRDTVLAADVEENDEKLATALAELKEYVFSHIVVNVTEENGIQKVSFGTGPFYLEHQYLRAANKALDAAEASLVSDTNPHGNIYGEASEICREQAYENGWDWSSAGYINCMVSEIQKYPAADELQDTIVAKLPSTELYRHNYASPVWAPTLAGFLMLVTMVILAVIVFRALAWIFIRISLVFV